MNLYYIFIAKRQATTFVLHNVWGHKSYDAQTQKHTLNVKILR